MTPRLPHPVDEAEFLPRVQAIRWRLSTPEGFPAGQAILATDQLRKAVVHGLDTSRDPEDFLLGGHNPNDDTEARWGRHAHAHWLWTERESLVRDLMLWVPAGLAPPQVRRVVSVTALLRYELEPPGYRGGDLLLQALGAAATVLADVGAGTESRSWASATPVLTGWHLTRGDSWDDVVRRFLEKELDHRFGNDVPRITTLEVSDQKGYRTRRWDPKFPEYRAFRVHRLELDRAVPGLLSLGALSHFGFGRLEPT